MTSLAFPGFDKLPIPSSRGRTNYFSNYKKGEVGELRALLRKMLLDSKTPSATEKLVSQIVDPNIDHFKVQNTKKRRSVLRKLIGCMTLGIDLSSLYTDVVMVSQTDDPVQKKMIYLYLSKYSMDNPDLAVLAINTLLKDIDSHDPVIRSLALRNLSSFGTNLSNEYATMSVLKKMFDHSDSVKRTAIIGSIRIYKSNCNTYGKDSKNTYDLLEDLKMALRSKNVHVMTDAMCAVSEIAEYERKIPLSTPSVIYLTNCLKNMDEWEQCSVLEVLCTYKPSNKDEMFDLMNLLDDKLKHNSSAIFLATSKCFLMWTRDDLFLQLEVVRRLQEPFISLVNRSRNEISYVLLSNILSLIVNVTHLLLENPEFTESSEKKFDIPFVEYFETFYCQYDDPTYIKDLKLSILISICTEENCLYIVQELNDYVYDTNHDIANKSVTALGIIALKIPSQLSFIIEKVSDIYKLNLAYLNPSVLHVIRALLSVYPELTPQLLEIVKDPSDYITYPEAKAHHIGILGEYGFDLDHTPYTLEDYTDDPDRTDLMTLELIPASIKVFLHRPAEMHKALSRLLHITLNESKNPDLVSSANFYYNLLFLGPEEARKVMFEDKGSQVQPDCDLLLGQNQYFVPDPEWREHFNTLYVLDGCTGFYESSNPIFFPFEHKDIPTDIFREDDLRKVVEDYSPRSSYVNISGETFQQQVPDPRKVEDALFEELENEVKYFNLVQPGVLTTEEFEKVWVERESSFSTEVVSNLKNFDSDDLEEVLSKLNMMKLSTRSDEQEGTQLFLYTKDEKGATYYIEVFVKCGENGLVKVTLKVNEPKCEESSLQSLCEILCDFVNRWVNR